MAKIGFSRKKKFDELNKSKTFTIGVYLVLCIVALAMTVINIITSKGMLTLVTGIFAFLCVLNILLVLIGEKTGNVARMLFAVEILAMFTFFLVSGNPDGFSAIWICLLPPAATYFFGKKYGSVICAFMFALLVFFLWLPIGNSLLMYDYNDTFRMRFPILFVAFFALAYFLEVRREKAYDEMHRLQDYYRELSARDSLTKLFNRQGMYARLAEEDKRYQACVVYAAMFDIDNFKHYNDTYGHDEGDIVLKATADILFENLKGVLCRWGGEEFVAIIPDFEFNRNDLENVRKTVEALRLSDNNEEFGVTVSIGVASGKFDISTIDALVADADVALYEAKTTGKNKIVYSKK